MPTIEEVDSIWEAIEPTKGDATMMKIRSQLMSALTEEVRRWGVSISVAAKKLCINSQRCKKLFDGKINDFNIDELIVLCVRVGINVDINISKFDAV